MVSIVFKSPLEVSLEIAKRVREKRLEYNWSQKTLSIRSGVKYGTLKKFEQTGKISLESLLMLARVMRSLTDFDELFEKKRPKNIDLMMKQVSRKRGRE